MYDTVIGEKRFELTAGKTSSIVSYYGIWNSKLSKDSAKVLDSDLGRLPETPLSTLSVHQLRPKTCG